ncbi:hypothetical protein ZOSMA_20G01110 [Zostera marina]|uniref:Large ribosomal subunit protein bL32m n=1 Tax=Zostera marina TaxID=29655 RepID=A0A0K9PKS3_ZOSMR|nr:hypothetical protein ZOSMA_20G01110 [Zostera marina]
MAAAMSRKNLFTSNLRGLFLERWRIRSISSFAVAPSFSTSMTQWVAPKVELFPQVPPSLPFGGSMELMAVPKKKVSKYKKKLRNGPKALKPVPVIVRCLACGRVKLPHFYCCSGERGISEQPN